MRDIKNKYTVRQYFATILMLFALVWLTVSLPYVYETKLKIASIEQGSKLEVQKTAANPFANTTEENTCGGINTLTEEYIHHSSFDSSCPVSGGVQLLALHYHEGTYTAFHGELLCPPPNAA